MYKETKRMGRKIWHLVNVKGRDVQEEANTIPISKKPTGSRWTITTEFSPPKGVSVRYARVVLVNDTLQLITTIVMDKSGDCSVQDAIQALRDSWTTSQWYVAPSGT